MPIISTNGARAAEIVAENIFLSDIIFNVLLCVFAYADYCFFLLFLLPHHPRIRASHVRQFLRITQNAIAANAIVSNPISRLPKNGLASIILRKRCGVVPVP